MTPPTLKMRSNDPLQDYYDDGTGNACLYVAVFTGKRLK